MRLNFINVLSEDIEKKRPYLIKKLQDAYAQHNLDKHINFNQIIDWLAQADPVAVKSNNRKTPYVNKILDWLLASEIMLPYSIETIRDALAKYNDLFHHGKIKNIDEYDSFNDFKIDVGEALGSEDKGVYNYLELEGEIPGFKMYRIDTFEQAQKAFDNSGWCVKNRGYFEDYDPPFYMVVTDKNKRYALLHKASNQVKDVYNKPIVKSEMLEPIAKFISMVWPESVYSESAEYKDPYAGYMRALQAGKRWRKAEPYIIRDAYWASKYAADVMNIGVKGKKKRWLEAEPIIIKDPLAAYNYALNVIQGVWKEAESNMMNDPDVMEKYVKNIVSQYR